MIACLIAYCKYDRRGRHGTMAEDRQVTDNLDILRLFFLLHKKVINVSSIEEIAAILLRHIITRQLKGDNMKPHLLKRARELRGWSQAKVAEALDVSTRTVRRWEQGSSVPYVYYHQQLCDLFEKDATELGLAVDELDDTMRIPDSSGRQSVEKLEEFVSDPAIPDVTGDTWKLLGRKRLLKGIKERLLHQDDLTLAALNGLPGIGKTTLAAALAKEPEVRAHFYDGILWAELGAQPDVPGILARWGALLEIVPDEIEDVTSWESWGHALRAQIRDRHMLLVIDDAWSTGAALAFQLGGDHCAHLLTTRSPQIALQFSQHGAITVPELDEQYGVMLLRQYVPQLVEHDRDGVRTLVYAVGGLPLALTLMGKYLATQAFTGQPRRLQNALAHLNAAEKRLRMSVPTTFQGRSRLLQDDVPLSLYATISNSIQQLSSRAFDALCALAVFPAKPNRFSEEVALAVVQDAHEVLDELWDHGLLESSGPDRYTLHQTIADYARLQPISIQANQCLVAYILQFIQRHIQNYDLLETESVNIYAGLEAALKLEMQREFIQGIISLIPFMRVRGLYSQAEHYLQIALQVAIALQDMVKKVDILSYLALFARSRGDSVQARKRGLEGLAQARQLKLGRQECSLLTTLGHAMLDNGVYGEAQPFLTQGLELARRLEDEEQVATLLGLLGECLRHQGIYSQAEALLVEGLRLARQHNLFEQSTYPLMALGALESRRSNFKQGEHYFLEALSQASRQGHRDHQIRILSRLGSVKHYQGDHERAMAYALEGLVLARQIGHQGHIIDILGNLGGGELGRNNYAQAEHYLNESMLLARQHNPHWTVIGLMNLGKAVGMLGDYKRAATYFQECLDMSRSAKDLWSQTAALIYRGEVHLHFQMLEEASQDFYEVIRLTSGEEYDPQLLAWAQFGIAQLEQLQGNMTEASIVGEKSLKVFVETAHYKAAEVRAWLQSLPQSERHCEDNHERRE